MSSQTRSGDGRTRQQQSSHMLKTGRRGNPFCKDTHDLFATLMVSLDLSDRTRFFRTYPNAFTTDDAAANLASLRFSQSNRTSDPNDPQRIVTTTTTTTFSMSRDIAKGICQHFMDARLIENAADPSSLTFKDRGIYQITPKGLHILERFITKNGISADHLIPVFTTQPICMKLLHLERRQSDDEIHVSRSVIDVVFRRFAGGRNPNYVAEQHDGRGPAMARPFLESVRLSDSYDRGNGVELQDVTEKAKSGQVVVVKQVFASAHGVDWLLDYSTCCCRDEAGELLAHMVRYGLIVLYADRSRTGDRVTVVEVQGQTGQTAEYRFGPRVLYRITDEGRRVAQGASGVDGQAGATGAKADKVGGGGDGGAAAQAPAPAVGRDSASTADDDQDSTRTLDKPTSPGDRSFLGGTGLSGIEGSLVGGRRGMADLFKSNLNEQGGISPWSKDSHSTTTRLRAILDEPALRALFRDFLRANYCDENLGFWLEVSDFRRRFSTTSSAVGASSKRKAQGGANAIESHQQNLVAAALHIYNTYLAPLSPNELNIDHNLRADVVNYVNRSLAEVGVKNPGADGPSTGAAIPTFPVSTSQTGSVTGSSSVGDGSDQPIPPLRATQVQTLLRQYERIQEHIFRLLATDQVPRFIRTEPFLALMQPEALTPPPSTSTNSAPAPSSTPTPSGDDSGTQSTSNSPSGTPKPPQGQIPATGGP
ncbi:GTPase-activating protein SST2 [Rhodotorula paludigena]|uniref:GTPase-activating protein SST2 n=1 Tax=Rhodotorula paludigena TaxID=86838 RepID=UPI00317FAE54